MELILAAFCKDAFGSALDDNNGNEPRERVKRVLDIACASQLARLSLVGEEDVHTFQHGLDILGPKVFRVVVGVE